MPVNIYRSKLVILGESTVGKTALLQMVISDGREFPKIYNMTLGTDLQSKRFSIINSEDVVEMLIYDSTGLDLYTNSLTQFWDQPDLLMIVYDVTSPFTFDAVNNWHKVAMSAEWGPIARSPSAAVLFANKTDLTSRRHVSVEDGQALADKLDMVYFEGSAVSGKYYKENQSVNEAFYWLAQEWHRTCTQSSQTNIKPSYDLYHKTVLRSGSSNNSSPVLI